MVSLVLLNVCEREDIQENVIQQNRQQLIRWLEDQESKGEEMVTLAQFCDMLMLRPGVGREDAIRVRMKNQCKKNETEFFPGGIKKTV